MRARVALATAALLAAVALASCGEKQETLGSAQPEPFDLALDFYVNPDHAASSPRSTTATSSASASRSARGCPRTPRRR